MVQRTPMCVGTLLCGWRLWGMVEEREVMVAGRKGEMRGEGVSISF